MSCELFRALKVSKYETGCGELRRIDLGFVLLLRTAFFLLLFELASGLMSASICAWSVIDCSFLCLSALSSFWWKPVGFMRGFGFDSLSSLAVFDYRRPSAVTFRARLPSSYGAYFEISITFFLCRPSKPSFCNIFSLCASNSENRFLFWDL